MQLQLSLTLADDLYDLLLMRGHPLDFLDAAQRILALQGAPPELCRQVMDTLVSEDRRFCWSSPTSIGLIDWRLADPDLAEVTFVAIDLETTGTRPGDGRITEIGAVRIEGLREVRHFETLVNPLRPIPPIVTEITGITQRMVLDAPRIEEVIPHFLDFLQGAVIVGHNAAFDLSFLNYELARLKSKRLGDGAIDTINLARRLAPGLPNYRLATVAEALGAPTLTYHRALPDAQATAHVFLTLVGRLQEQGVTRLNQARSFVDRGHKPDRQKLALTQDLPRRPGVYLFLDGDDQILYVGRADCLRDRVRSYFLTNTQHPRRVRQALRRLEHVAWEETGSPLHAAVREQELILQHRPPCNVYGRRPENYVYIKAGGRHGLRLYLSKRPTRLSASFRAPQDTSKVQAPKQEMGRSLVLGPFRSRKRAQAALELLHRCYPLRRCRGKAFAASCIHIETGRCLAPCLNHDRREANDRLVVKLMQWLSGESPAGIDDPLKLGRNLMQTLAQQQRFEEAEEVRQALEDLAAVRRSYWALAQARSLKLAVLSPDGDRSQPVVHLDLIWEGLLHASVTLDDSSAPLQIGRLVRSVPRSPDESQPDKYAVGEGLADEGLAHRGREEWVAAAVVQEQLDVLLAVRRWLLDTPQATAVPLPVALTHEERVELWRQQLSERVQDLLGERPA